MKHHFIILQSFTETGKHPLGPPHPHDLENFNSPTSSVYITEILEYGWCEHEVSPCVKATMPLFSVCIR